MRACACTYTRPTYIQIHMYRRQTDISLGEKKRMREERKEERKAGILIEEWFAPSIKNLVCFWPTDIEEKLFASGI